METDTNGERPPWFKTYVLTAFGALVTALLVLQPSPGAAQTYTVLAGLAASDAPCSRLALCGTTLYGATRSGGGSTTAILFKVETNGTGFRTLYQLGAGEAYVVGSDGVLYGAMSVTGASTSGRLFAINTNGDNYRLLRELDSGGAFPRASLILSGSTLYGTTERTGYIWGDGAVLRISTNGTDYVAIKQFQNDLRADGRYPQAGLALSDGVLFGTTYSGGLSNCGTVFRVDTNGGNFTVLRHFSGSDGKNPKSDLVVIGNTLYGTTYSGGSNDTGVIFRMNQDGSDFAWVWSFSTVTNGAHPGTGLVRAGDMLYGTTRSPATLFRIRTNGTGHTVLKRFPNNDQINLQPLLLVGQMIYGSGAALNYSVVFSLSLEPPRILEPPGDIMAASGTTVDISINTVGALPMAYQWRFNAAPLQDQTNSVLRLSRVELADAGAYAVVITNLFGAVTSAPVNLTILHTAPVIDDSPSSRRVPIGAALDFSISAHGSLPMEYQWFFNRTNRLGETTATLHLSDVQLSQAGTYTVLVTNAFGSATSPPAFLAVTGVPPSILTQPVDRLAAVGASVDFAITASGTSPLACQWFFNSTNVLPIATDMVLHLAVAKPVQAGSYHAVVTNLYGTATSSPALLTLTPSAPLSSCTDFALRSAMALGGTVTFACDGVILLTNTITNTVDAVVDGTGHRITISGGTLVPVLEVKTNTHLRLINLTIADGMGSTDPNLLRPNRQGGGLVNEGGTVELYGVTFANNMATSGGAIFSQNGTVQAADCAFFGNQAQPISLYPVDAQGGAILSQNGRLSLQNCTFNGNRAVGMNAAEYLAWGASASGGAVCSLGSLTVSNCSFLANSASGGAGFDQPMFALAGATGTAGGNGNGGAIWSSGELIIGATLFLSNMVSGGNGGIGGRGYNEIEAGSNGATPGAPGGAAGSAQGGALYHLGGGEAANCTFAYNQATGGIGGTGGQGGSAQLHGDRGADGGDGGNGGSALGGIVGSIHLVNCTVAFNSATPGNGGSGGNGGAGMGINLDGAPGTSGNRGIAGGGVSGVSCVNTLLATNTPGGNCLGAVTDTGHNLSSDGTCGFTQVGSVNKTDPRLGTLANYGGPTLTLPLLPGSPAVDAADPATAPSVDQRGLPRPAGARADIGAFEYGAIPLLFIDRTAEGGLEIQAWGTANSTCRLLLSTDLIYWIPVATNQLDSSGVCQFRPENDLIQRTRFYRLSTP